MQFPNQYYKKNTDGHISITGQQGSDFAKRVAGDFNLIHDVDSKRFCVPGDLLFAIALSELGLHQTMSFRFLDMVGADSTLMYPAELGDSELMVNYVGGRDVLAIKAAGDVEQDIESIEALVRKYVAFSGQNFPHILVPLMEQNGVMINPARPLVIYESMSFDLQTLKFNDLAIKLEETSLDVQGKRGNALLNFSFHDTTGEVGRGAKKLVLSGLRAYDAAIMQQMCDDYSAVAQAGFASA